MILFDILWSEALEMPMSDAVSRLEGLLELIQHHPALAPEIANLRQLCDAWWGLLPRQDTCRLATFEIRLDAVRGMKMGDAVFALLDLVAAHKERRELARALDQIFDLWHAWESVNESPVLERSRKL